ncbi:glycosyltransferase family 15 protein [Backusella circina FSU 941]|nr:glycosyltransferase family 15 protein [Backusella circina FSU 941]
MIPVKTLIRFLIVILVLLTGLFLFTQSTNPLLSTAKHDVTTRHQSTQDRLIYPHGRFKAAFYTFVKEDIGTLTKLRRTIRSLEDQFNKDHNYPYVIFTDQELSKDYKTLASSLTKADVYFEKVSGDLYGYPPNTDMKKAEQARIKLNGTMFGDSEDYRFQSRFMAGTIYRHPIMKELDYGWRFEAGTEYVCPIDEDPFQFMFETKKTTSFSMALYEYPDTIPTLYDNVVKYALEYKELVQQKENPKALWNFIWEPNSETFNRCHFWNNFQILVFIEGKSTKTSLII